MSTYMTSCKRIFLFLILALFCQKSFSQAPKMVIVEEFTNASCPPCASQNPGFIELLKQNEVKIIPIKYQTQFPGYDPYNEQNNTDVLIRSDIYEITGVPTALIDGVLPDATYGGGIGKWASEGWYPGAPGGFNQEVLDYAASVISPVGLVMEVFWNEDLTRADVYVHITNHGNTTIEGFFRVPLILVELDNKWPFPPGGTNEVHFTNVMRRMYDSKRILNLLAPGASMTFEFLDLEIPEYIFDLKEMAFVSFIQNTQTLEILNGAITENVQIPDLYPDMAIRGKRTTFSGEECGKTAILGMLVENTGQHEIQSFTAVFNLGNEVHQIDHDIRLNPGDSLLVISTEPVILPSGAHQISYSIENINGNSTREINRLNNLVINDPFSAIAIRPMDSFDLDFENDKPGAVSTPKIRLVSPNNFFIRISEKSMFPNVNEPMGAFGDSEKSIFINFRQWNTASFNKKGSILLLDNADIHGLNEIEIMFDRSHAQRDKSGTLSNDLLEAFISFDCGQSWTSVYKKSGSELATVSPQSERFFPALDQWATDTITLEGLSSETLMLKFEIESDHGNSLLLDNLKILKKFVNTENFPLTISKMNIYPNPVSEKVHIDLGILKKTFIELSIIDLDGKPVKQLQPKQALNEGDYRYEWVPEHDGLFIISLNDSQRTIFKKLAVIRR